MTLHELEDILISIGVERVSLHGNRFRALCPLHSETRPSFGLLAEEPYPYNCFGCNKTGTLADLIVKLTGVSFKDAFRRLNMHSSIGNIKPLDDEKKEEVAAILSEALLAVYKRTEKVYTYMEKRGIRRESVKKARCLYDPEENRVLFPWRLEGKLRSLTGRAISKNNPVKTLPYYESKKGTALYSPTGTLCYDTLTLVEGEIDSIKVMDAGFPNVAALGFSAFTSHHLKLIRANRVKTLCLFFDDDSTGEAITEKVYEKTHDEFKVIRVDYAPFRKRGVKKLDPGALKRKDIRRIVKAANDSYWFSL